MTGRPVPLPYDGTGRPPVLHHATWVGPTGVHRTLCGLDVYAHEVGPVSCGLCQFRLRERQRAREGRSG